MADDNLIHDEIVAREISLARFTAGERIKVLAILKRMEEDLVELLFYSGAKLTDIARADKARLLKQAQGLIAGSYGAIDDEVAQSLASLGQVEAVAMAATLEAAFRGAISPALPTEAFFRKLAGNALIEGAPSAAWWKRQAGDVAFRFQTQVAQGLAQAETNDQIISRIRGRASAWRVVEGKRVYDYVGGVMQVARHNAAALVQTSVQTVSNAARMETFEANGDVIKGYQQVSTLDGHTTLVCVAYSGAAWDAKFQPVAPTVLPFLSPNGAASGTPRHWNCRSLVIPKTKTFREMGLDIPEFEPTTRAATGGPVSAKLQFDGFLTRKGPQFTDDLLGPGRAELWRKGAITLQQLLDQSGRPLTLKELERLYGRR